jgi:choline kinase
MSSVRDAIVLAAGTGTRLRSVVDDRPKGLIEIRGQSLVGRSAALLCDAGIDRITIVAGYLAEMYRAFARDHRHVRILINDAFETTGSMASLAIGLDAVPDADVLIVESDIAYEARALRTVLSGAANATLVSGPTGAGDEVWVCAPDGRLQAMSKVRAQLPSVAGEFVGLTRLSAAAASAMRDAFGRFTAQHAHGRMDYETGALVEVAGVHTIAAPLIADLCWGEIDDEQHYRRMVDHVWPSLIAR